AAASAAGAEGLVKRHRDDRGRVDATPVGAPRVARVPGPAVEAERAVLALVVDDRGAEGVLPRRPRLAARQAQSDRAVVPVVEVHRAGVGLPGREQAEEERDLELHGTAGLLLLPEP